MLQVSPAEDEEELRSAGVAAVLGPGASAEEVVQAVRESVASAA